MLGTDRLKAAAGAEHAKNRLGVLDDSKTESGPVQFPARYKGRKGHLYITTMAATPALSWTTEKEDIDPVFTIAIEDIKVGSPKNICEIFSLMIYRSSRKLEALDGRRSLL